MKTVTEIFTIEKNKKENKPIFLYTLYDYDGLGTNLYWAEYKEEVEFDSITYTPFSITFEAIGEQTGGQVDEVKVTVGNVTRLIQNYLELYDFRGKKVRILQVFADIIDEPDAFLEDIFYVDKWEQPNDEVIVFTLSSRFNCRDVKLPKRLFVRTSCPWEFKSADCGYAGDAVTCDRTLQNCRALGNTVGYGGWPSSGGGRLYI